MKNKINRYFLFSFVCGLLAVGSQANAAPTIAFTAPSSPVVNKTNQAFLRVAGTCSEIGEQVKVTVVGKVISAQAVCQEGGLWSIENFSVVNLPDGAFTLSANFLSGSATAATIALTKDTASPLLTMTSPMNGSAITSNNYKTLKFVGRCGELNSDVVVTLKSAMNSFPQQVTGKVVCTSTRIYAITVDTSTLPDLSDIQAMVTHGDAAGNVSRQDIVLFKDAEPINVTLAGLPAAVNITNAASLKIGGTCNKPSNPIFFDVLTANGDLAQTLETVCSDSGQWEIPNISITEIPDGRVTFTVTHFSLNTNDDSSKSVALNKDVVPPVLAVSSPASGFKMNTVTGTVLAVTGDCTEEGRNVDLGTPVKVASAVCREGKFSISYNFSPALDGDVLVRVSQSDAAGNTAVQSLSFQKDVLPPSLTFTNPTSLNITANNAANLVFGGSCSEHGAYAQSVTLAFSGATSQCEGGSCVAQCVGGAWSMMASVTTAADGDFVVTARHQDSAGNAAQVVRTFKKDTVPPSLTITTPAIVEGSKYRLNASNVRSVTFAGTCTENGAVITLSDSTTGSVVCQNLSWSIIKDLSSVADGDRNIRFKITDAVGNYREQDLVLFKDTVLPKLAILVPAANPFNMNAENSANVVFSGTCSEKAAYAQPVLLTGAIEATAACTDAGTWSIMFSRATIADGEGQITVSHSDMAGNKVSLVKRFIKDSTPPTLTITSPEVGFKINLTNVTAVPFRGTCSEVGRTVALSGAATASAKCTTSKTWAVNVDMSGSPDGDLLITAIHSDAALNSVRQDIGLYKKTVLPTLTWDQPTDDIITEQNATALVLKGTCSENGRQVNITGGNIAATALCNKKSWALTLSVAGFDLTNFSLNASHSDLAGNIAEVRRVFKSSLSDCDVPISSAEDFNKASQTMAAKSTFGISRYLRYCLLKDVIFDNTNQPPKMSFYNAQFDGRGFAIRGFILTSRGGFFERIDNSKISNLIMDNITIDMSQEDTEKSHGLLVNYALGASFENISLKGITSKTPINSSTFGFVSASVSGYSKFKPSDNETLPIVMKGITIDFGTLEFQGLTFAGLVGNISTFYDVSLKDIYIKGNVTRKQYLVARREQVACSGVVGGISSYQPNKTIIFDNVRAVVNIACDTTAAELGSSYSTGLVGKVGRGELSFVNSSYSGTIKAGIGYSSAIGGFSGQTYVDSLSVKNSSVRGVLQGERGNIGGLVYAFAGYTGVGRANARIENNEVGVKLQLLNTSTSGGIFAYINGTANINNNNLKASMQGSTQSLSTSFGGVIGAMSETSLLNITNSNIDVDIQIKADNSTLAIGGLAGYPETGGSVRTTTSTLNLSMRGTRDPKSTLSLAASHNTYSLGVLSRVPANIVPTIIQNIETLKTGGTPNMALPIPTVTGSVDFVGFESSDLVILGTASEPSTLQANLASVMISAGTNANNRRFIGYVDTKTPTAGSFRFVVPASMVNNLKGKKIFAEGISRIGQSFNLSNSGVLIVP